MTAQWAIVKLRAQSNVDKAKEEDFLDGYMQSWRIIEDQPQRVVSYTYAESE